MAKQTTFLNISVNSMVKDTLADAYAGISETDILVEFMEGLSDGLKFSMSSPEDKNATCVAITLPHNGSKTESICSTFWGETNFDALFEAFIVYRFFEAGNHGLYKAKDAMLSYEKDMRANLKRFMEEGNTPVKTKLMP